MNHDNGGHSGHGDMPGMPGPTCTTHMLWNTQIANTCVIFPSWHITSTTSFVLSFFAIVLLGILYEYLRLVQHRVDVYISQVVRSRNRGKRPLRSTSPSPVGRISEGNDEDRELLTGRKVFKPSAVSGIPVPIIYRLLRAGIYGSTVFLSFFLMLVFMTYNAYLILAVVLGACIGHFKFGATFNDVDGVGYSNGKGLACH